MVFLFVNSYLLLDCNLIVCGFCWCCCLLRLILVLFGVVVLWFCVWLCWVWILTTGFVLVWCFDDFGVWLLLFINCLFAVDLRVGYCRFWLGLLRRLVVD